MVFLCFFKQKTAYKMRISDWSSDVCSSDLLGRDVARHALAHALHPLVDVVLGVEPLVGLGRRPADAGDSQDLVEPPTLVQALREAEAGRSEERRGGKVWVSPCRDRGSPYPYKKNLIINFYITIL